MQLRKGQDLFFIAIGHSAQVMNWQLERFVLCCWQPKSTGTVWAVGGHVRAVLCADSQPFCPGLGKGDEGRSHPELLLPMVRDIQQDVPISTVPSQVLSGVWGHWRHSVRHLWPGAGNAPLWSSLLELFNQLFHSSCCPGWHLLESGRGDICWAGVGWGGTRPVEAAVQPRLSAITPGKRPLFLGDAVKNSLCLCTSTAELNVLPIFFPLHCLHLLAFIYIQM